MKKASLLYIVYQDKVDALHASLLFRLVFPHINVRIFNDTLMAYQSIVKEDGLIPDVILIEFGRDRNNSLEFINMVNVYFSLRNEKSPIDFILLSDDVEMNASWLTDNNYNVKGFIHKPISKSKIKEVFDIKNAGNQQKEIPDSLILGK